ncbi:MAG: Beta-galactosidase [Luteibacter sp.]|uniref:glycoside hydrolase family 35 protein n=1 Tax=Luteibacter sp. TaxID=1886636 RepID=UPI00137D4247|nr:beta-galactosidase family protein [Luteibacter sp.]KAF1005152.1 MAG: Beta-galactosidase [Luteibacter sp.]
MKGRVVSVLAGVAMALAMPSWAGSPLAIDGDHFVRDGKPWLVRSGEMHYPRIPHEAWRDRLRKAKAMGLNTITTYAFWNVNEPEPGKFDFSGDGDIASFVRIAKEEGLDVILRPGPYVYAEWNFGGFPAWLLRTPGLRVRSYDPRFLAATDAWFKRLHKELEPLLSSHGGNIVMVQVENEYGSYGEDRDYLEAIHKQIVDAGFDVPLFMSNGPGPGRMEPGTLPGLLPVINFDGDAADAKEAFDESAPYLKGYPKMTGEYWSGWYDRWGEPHQTRTTAVATSAVGWFIDNKVSFNLYMVDGGTNFGWMAGANEEDHVYKPVTTSYDYDAPIDEAGRLTPKYMALRKLIGAHLSPGETLPKLPASSPTMAIPTFNLDASVSLLDALPALSKPQASVRVRPMEAFDQNYGLILYCKRLDADVKGDLNVGAVRDFATVLVDGQPRGTLDRRLGQRTLATPLKQGDTLDLLVENMGRVNFGSAVPDEYKGLRHEVSIGKDVLSQWQVYPLPLNDLSTLPFHPGLDAKGPRFLRGGFALDKVAGGSFIDMRGWSQGHVWINGHHLGRYWNIGPQQTLFVPAEWLRKGRHDVVVLEMGEKSAGKLAGLRDPVFSTR